MLEFTINPALLGNTRFTFSPLAEVAASIRLLALPWAAHPHQPWIRRTRQDVDGVVDMGLLSVACPPSRFPPDYLFAPPGPGESSIDDQLDALARYPAARFVEQLRLAWSGRRETRAVEALVAEPEEGLRRLAEELAAYWSVAIQPSWSRICGVLEDDVSYRASRSMSGGLYSLLEDLHPEISVAGDVLSIDKAAHQGEMHHGTALTLIPSVFLFPELVVGHDPCGTLSAIYTARGVGRVWEGPLRPATRVDRDALGALVGPTRARILRHLDVPMTTTTLARHMHLTPSNVSQHLTVLKENGLLLSWRSGRDVLYRQTPLAQSLVDTVQVAGQGGTA